MSARQPHELLMAAQPAMPGISGLVATVDGQPVTTTLKVAAGTATTHEAAIKLVRTHLGDMEEFGLVRFEIAPRSIGQHGGGDTEYAVLNEQQSSLLLAYMRNTEIVRHFKKALIREFFQMRTQLAAPTLPNFSDPAAAARAWADEVEAKCAAEAGKLRLEHKLAEQAPALAAFDRIANAGGMNTLTVAAKFLQLQPGELISYLLARKWMYKRTSRSGNTWYIAFQDKLDVKYLSHKYGSYQDIDTGERKTKEQVLVTRKGVAKLAEMLAVDAVSERLAAEPGQHQQRLPLPEDDG